MTDTPDMCGIAGIVRFDGAPIARETLHAMGAALRHRGPDAEGVHVDSDAAPSVGLVHRRLSIIDLSEAANQPIAGEHGRVVGMLNGEIYNFRDLRRSLGAGHTFRSAGDTEVVVHGYEDRGDEIVAALDGMFALAIWDAGRRRLLLATDRFGKKPVYWWSDGRQFVFGSEIKALLAAGVPAAMDDSGLGEYLSFGYVPTPRTMFAGIAKMPPATMLTVDAHGVAAPRRYWDLEFDGGSERADADTVADRVRTLLSEAVRKRLVADVPLGVLLSGGVDSAAIAALAAPVVTGRLKTFTVGFEGPSFYDERLAARSVAQHLGTEHHESVVRPAAAELVETLLAHYDEPFGDSSALPTYLVAREARREVTVVLNGDGGDETFAGYDRFHAALLAERLPRTVRHALGGAARFVPRGSTYHGTLRRLRRFTEQAARPVEERMAAWAGFFDLPSLSGLARNGLADPERILASYRDALGRCASPSLLSRLLYANARTYLLDDLLPKADRMTMAHGLEARSPFLDRDLVEYVARLPDGQKRQGREGKIALKRALRGLVPPDTLRRPKHGFGVPLGAWFRTDLRPMVEDVLLDRPRLGRWLRPEGVRDVYVEHTTGHADWGHRLWLLLTLELWLRKHRFA